MRRIYTISPGQIAAGTTADPITVKWTRRCRVVGIGGSTAVNSDAERATVALSVSVDGSTSPLAIDENGGNAYVPLACLHPREQAFYPLMRDVVPHSPWVVTIQNLQADATRTPTIAIHVEEEE